MGRQAAGGGGAGGGLGLGLGRLLCVLITLFISALGLVIWVPVGHKFREVSSLPGHRLD